MILNKNNNNSVKCMSTILIGGVWLQDYSILILNYLIGKFFFKPHLFRVFKIPNIFLWSHIFTFPFTSHNYTQYFFLQEIVYPLHMSGNTDKTINTYLMNQMNIFISFSFFCSRGHRVLSSGPFTKGKINIRI